MITLSKIKGLRRFFARHRSLLYLETGLIWLFFAAILIYAIAYFAVPSMARSQLQQLCGGAVDIQAGGLKGVGAIRLDRVAVAEDVRSLPDAPIFQADRIVVRFEPWQLLRGRFSIRSIQLNGAMLSIDYDPSQEAWNFEKLSFQKNPSPKADSLPLISVKQGVLRLRRTGPDGPTVLARVGIRAEMTGKPDSGDYLFLLETDGRFGFGESRLEGGLHFGQDGSQGRLWATGRILMPEAGILLNRWDVRDIKLDCRYDERAIRVDPFAFSIGAGRAEVNGEIGRTGRRDLKLNVQSRGIGISETFASDTLVYGRLGEFFESPLTRFLNRYHPAGKGDAELSVAGTLDDVSAVRLDGVIRCAEVAVCDNKFPYQLENMHGDIEFTGQTIHLKQLQAQHGDVRLQIGGTIERGKPKDAMKIQFRSANLRFDEDLYKALSPSVQKIWYTFSPTGRTGVDYRFQQSHDGQHDVALTLGLDDAGAVCAYFPYPLEHLTGSISVTSQQLEFKDVSADYKDGRRVWVDGAVYRPDDADPVYHITIGAEHIPVDERLVKAMPKKQQDLFSKLQIDGAADLKVDIFPSQTEKGVIDYFAGITLNAEHFLHERFPLPMTDVKMTATVTQDLVLLDAFEAQTDSGHLRLGKSRIWPEGADPNRPGARLSVDLKNLELNEMFWKAAGPEAGVLFGGLRTCGVVDVNGLLEVNLPSTSGQGHNLTIDYRDNPLVWNGAEVGRMNGRLKVRGDHITFSDFGIKDIDLQALPEEWVNGKVQPMVAWAKPKGRVSVSVEDGFVKAGHGQLSLLDVAAKIDLEDVSFQRADSLGELEGFCRGRFVMDANSGRWSADARYQANRLTYRGWEITALSGNLRYDPNTLQLVSDDLSAVFYQGRVKGALSLDMREPEQMGYQLKLDYEDVDLNKLFAAARSEANRRADQGRASGGLALEGRFSDLAEPRGRLSADVSDLKMGRQSLLGKILTAVQLKQADDFVFNEIQLSADILGPSLIFDEIRMAGNPLVFYGSGRMDLQSRDIQMELASWDRKLGDEETILETLARGIGAALWKIEIGGTLDEPEVGAVYLSVLKQPLDIFKKKDNKK